MECLVCLDSSMPGVIDRSGDEWGVNVLQEYRADIRSLQKERASSGVLYYSTFEWSKTPRVGSTIHVAIKIKKSKKYQSLIQMPCSPR